MSDDDSAKIFKRQSGQMKAVVAETMEVLEATKEIVARMQSERPAALSLPPPAPQSLPQPRRKVDTGRYAVFNPPGTVPPAPAPVPAPKLAAVPRPPAVPRPASVVTPPTGISEVRVVASKAPLAPQAPRQAFRPLPPPLPRKAAASDIDDE